MLHAEYTATLNPPQSVTPGPRPISENNNNPHCEQFGLAAHLLVPRVMSQRTMRAKALPPFECLASDSGDSIARLVDEHDDIVFDMDGVLWSGSLGLLPGAADAIGMLRATVGQSPPLAKPTGPELLEASSAYGLKSLYCRLFALCILQFR